jgi:hypothetical protein
MDVSSGEESICKDVRPAGNGGSSVPGKTRTDSELRFAGKAGRIDAVGTP